MRKSVDWILLFCLLGLVECNTTEPIQEPEIKKLTKDLKSKHATVRQGAAEALEKIGTPEALKAVEEYQSRQ